MQKLVFNDRKQETMQAIEGQTFMDLIDSCSHPVNSRIVSRPKSNTTARSPTC